MRKYRSLVAWQRARQLALSVLKSTDETHHPKSRAVFGARISLIVGLLAPTLGLGVGILLGMATGYFRGRTESIIVAAMEAIMAFPGILIVLAVTAYVGASTAILIFLLGFLTIPAFMRVARANTLVFAERWLTTQDWVTDREDFADAHRESHRVSD